MKDEVKRYLDDILHSIHKIEKFTSGLTSFNTYEKNDLIKSAVHWQLAIIGEAINNALKEDTNLDISNARKIVDMRNKLIHGYDEVEDTVVWGVLIKHLPALKEEVVVLLNTNP